ncbi:MAG: right-handed parallel beta-helix repeat-containing protein [Acidobacteriota bacterium]|nr:right-handed parallel beta-helix repeat-containing protein [Acidobacteriota bacterium]
MSLNKIKASSTWTLCLILLLAGGSVMAGVSVSHPGNSSDGTFVSQPNPNARGGNVTNQNTATDYADLASAVAAASAGDTLVVNASFSEGTVNIDKNLTITGSGQTISAAVSTGNSGDARAWFLVDSGVSLTVSNLNFDGSGQEIYQAFRHKGTGSFTNCNFSNISFDSGGGTSTGFAIASFDDGASASLMVTGCEFSGYGKVGVLAFGDTTVTVDDCTFTGSGATTGSNVSYGVEAGGGAQVTVTNSIFVNNTDTEGTAQSAGVLGSTTFDPGTDITLTSNWFQDNYNGVLTPDPDGTAITGTFNSFIDNGDLGGDRGTPGTGYGVNVGDNTVSFENNWWGCNAGPNNAGCDGTNGSDVDYTPWLVLTPMIADDFVVFGTPTTVYATLNYNNEGVDVSGSGNVIDGLPVSFNANGLGSITPNPSETEDGMAVAEFATSPYKQTGMIDMTQANQTVSIGVTTVVTVVPTLGEYGMMAFVGLLAVAGMVMMRRNRTA